MSFVVTTGELLYQSQLLLDEKAIKVFLAVTGNLTADSTLAEWEAAELALENGYEPYEDTLGIAVYNPTTQRGELPLLTGQFGPADGGSIEFDAMVVKVGLNRVAPYAIKLYETTQVLASGQSRGFAITLGTKK